MNKKKKRGFKLWYVIWIASSCIACPTQSRPFIQTNGWVSKQINIMAKRNLHINDGFRSIDTKIKTVFSDITGVVFSHWVMCDCLYLNRLSAHMNTYTLTNERVHKNNALSKNSFSWIKHSAIVLLDYVQSTFVVLVAVVFVVFVTVFHFRL